MKKKLSLYITMAIFIAAFVTTMFLVPMIDVISKTMDENADVIIPASGTFNLLTFTKALPNIFDASYDAAGPVWLSIWGVILNWLVLFLLAITFIFIIFEICSIKKQNWALKKNKLTNKLAIATGYLALIVFVIEFASSIIITMLSNGYFIYNANIEIYITPVLALALLTCGYVNGRKIESDQKTNKLRDSLGFILTPIFAGVFVGMIFIPQTIMNHSFWQISSNASYITSPFAAEYFVGISQWTTFALFLPVAFLLIYGIIGFIRSLCGKSINWLSGAVKRWSTLLFILSLFYLFLMAASIMCIYGFFYFDGLFVFAPISIVTLISLPLPFILTRMISLNKKEKQD